MTTIRTRTFARLPSSEIRKFEREDSFRACLHFVLKREKSRQMWRLAGGIALSAAALIVAMMLVAVAG